MAALALVAKVRGIVEISPMLAHRSEETTQKTAQAIKIAMTDQLGFYEALLEMEAKRQAVQWIDGPGKTGSDSVGNEELGVKRGKD